MAVASRYIGGLPYDPRMSVGRYPNRASVGSTPGVIAVPGITGGGVGTGGGVVAPTVTALPIRMPAATSAQAGAESNLLAMLLSAAPLLQYLPDAYDAVSDWLSPSQQQATPDLGSIENAFDPGGTFVGPGGVSIPTAALGGLGTDWSQVFEPGTMTLDQAGTQALLNAPMPAGDQFAGLGAESTNALEGLAATAAPASTWAQAIQAAGGWDAAVQAGTLPTDLGLTGSLGELPLYGDVATGLADFGGGLAGGWIASQPFQNSDRPYAGIGQQAGSALGMLAGQAIIPIPFLGAAVGAALGGLAGGSAGSLMGPAPTVGRNFGAMGTFGGDGNLYWSNAGGDNGGSAADADAWTSWFGPNLMQAAAQHGLAFNPNMSGVQFNVGGYDNFWRGGRTAAGYFYDPYLSGSPESSALRPADDWMSGGYSAGQAEAFTSNVLADLTARGVFTQAGANQPTRDFYNSTTGADLGFYGSPGGAYSDIAQGGGGWDALLQGRQSAINGFLDQQAQERQRQADAQAQLDQSNRWAGMDVGALMPTMLLQAQNDPFLASNLGLPGVQVGEYGPMFTGPGSQTAAQPVYDPGGA